MFGPLVRGPLTQVTPTHLDPDVVAQLQEADDIVNQILIQHKLTRTLSQVPVVLVPVSVDKEGSRCIVIRTFITNDFMTGVPAVPGIDIEEEVVQQMVDRVEQVPGISRVLYDLTAKPPGTTEWE